MELSNEDGECYYLVNSVPVKKESVALADTYDTGTVVVKARLVRTEASGDAGDSAYAARNTVENLKAAMAAYYETEAAKEGDAGKLVVKVQMGGNSNIKYKEADSLSEGEDCWTNTGVTKTFTITSSTAASIDANPFVVISSTTFCYGLIGTSSPQDALANTQITVTADVSVVHAAS